MCLYPKLIKNRKYIPNKKNGGLPPECLDTRVAMVPIGCQKCIECRKQKARGWSVRLQEDLRVNKNAKFVTLTFSNESITELINELQPGLKGYELDNELATLGVRRFLERWRKEHGKSVRHWLVTELGHNGTENVHMHGFIWTDSVEDIAKIWNYGYVFVGNYVSEKSVNYMVKYISKVDKKHREYSSKILTSPGIGAGYTARPDSRLNKFKIKETDESYKTRQGVKLSLPIYYRNKIYSEVEREQLWIQKLEKKERWVCGERVDVSTPKGEENYKKLVEYYREKNKRLGYGNDEKNWDREIYERNRRELMINKRIEGVVIKKEDKGKKISERNWERMEGARGNNWE